MKFFCSHLGSWVGGLRDEGMSWCKGGGYEFVHGGEGYEFMWGWGVCERKRDMK